MVSIDELELVISEKLLSDLGYIPGYTLVSPPKTSLFLLLSFPFKISTIHFNLCLPKDFLLDIDPGY